MTHIRINLGTPDQPAKHVSLYDQILVVPDEGEPIDISSLVHSHRLVSTAGNARMLELELFSVGEINDTTITGTAEDAA